MTNAPDDLNNKLNAIEKKFDAADEEKKEKEARTAKIASMSATLKTAMEHMDDDGKKNMKAKILAGTDEDMKEAINSIPDLGYYNGPTPNENSNNSSIEGDGKTLSAIQAQTKKLEAQIAEFRGMVASVQKTDSDKYIESLEQYKQSVVSGHDGKAYKARLEALPFSQLKAMYEDRQDEMATLADRQQSASQMRSFGFPSGNVQSNEYVSLSTIEAGN